MALAAAWGMPAGKGCDFVAIAATGHGAPTAAASARGIIEKKAAGGVGADAKAGTCTFGDELRGRTRDGGKEPVQATFAGDESQAPFAVLLEEFIVAFGDAQDFIDRVDPIAQQDFFSEERAKDLVQGGMQPLSLAKECAGALRVILGECEELGAAFWGNDPGNEKKTEQLFPGETGGGVEFVGKIEGKPTADEVLGG